MRAPLPACERPLAELRTPRYNPQMRAWSPVHDWLERFLVESIYRRQHEYPDIYDDRYA